MLCNYVILFGCLVLALYLIKWLLRRKRRENTIGIFHLYCSSGGGGERVLWHSVKILLEKYPKYSIYIYTEKKAQDDSLQILLKAKNLFQIDLISDRRALERLEFIPLSLSPLVDPKKYPFLTLLIQNLMSVVVAIQAAYHFVPEVYMETIGFTYTLPLFKLFGCTVITYVHYPTISSDMINNVKTSSHASFNNREIFVRSSLLRNLKLLYYKFLVLIYGFAGRRADLVMVNSSWTRNHIKSLWQMEKVSVVYPPCDVDSFKRMSVEKFSESKKEDRNIKIVSIAQFRPEKNHELQIEAFDMFLNETHSASELTLYGGCRDGADKKRVDYLADLICRLDLGSRVRIVVNASFEQLLDGVRQADVALHSMSNEHFGIVLLEFMAAGLITLAHDSGGPKMDIIENETDGFLCKDVNEFSDRLTHVSKMSYDERQSMRRRATKKADKFGVDVFEMNLLKGIDRFLSGHKAHNK